MELRNNLSLTECALRWRHKTRLRAKSAAIWKIAEFAWFCDKFSDRRILEGLSDAHWTDQIQRKSCVHLYYSPLSLCLTAASSTRIFKRTHTHTHRNIWTTANQRGGPPFTISDWFRPRYKPNGGVFCWTTEFLSRGYFFFFCGMAGRTSAPWDFC